MVGDAARNGSGQNWAYLAAHVVLDCFDQVLLFVLFVLQVSPEEISELNLVSYGIGGSNLPRENLTQHRRYVFAILLRWAENQTRMRRNDLRYQPSYLIRVHFQYIFAVLKYTDQPFTDHL